MTTQERSPVPRFETPDPSRGLPVYDQVTGKIVAYAQVRDPENYKLAIQDGRIVGHVKVSGSPAGAGKRDGLLARLLPDTIKHYIGQLL